ncbi:SDR family NAD(P)-dependent oxidoreductase [Alteromonas aestuariivivens]|uniref:SDR family NAD(P)-dependent oxidoreductase n=1 Tax=Alteromonas aestuariivivens TaxID=1938339 RepID=A0A3D8M5M6_9ALTE|nr:SDR family NAD(P)-dependent oxidoreductase [Alteromonas aestuariivivens]RDV25047.1 SDR family NAD(P)-dependent oxidoreductase [Alteromonas aestuariivivens]
MAFPYSGSILQGHSVLVTGATGGIGRAIVSNLAQSGATVFAGGRNKVALDSLVEEVAGKVVPVDYDVTDENAVKEVFRTIQARQSDPDVGNFVGLVNNAGEMKEAGLVASNMELLRLQMSVNFYAAYQHMQLASRLMVRHRKGAIVNVVSQIGEQGGAGLSAYSASKAALTGATKSLAKELAPFGIRVNAVAPGFISTPMTAHYTQLQRDDVYSRVALKQSGTPQQVADAVLFLLDQCAGYTTGHVLPVDGLFQA